MSRQVFWSPEMVALLESAPDGTTDRQLAKMVNSQFGLSITHGAIISRRRALRESEGLSFLGTDGEVVPIFGAGAGPAIGLTRAPASPIDYLSQLGSEVPISGSTDGTSGLIIAVGDTQFPYEDPIAWAALLTFVRDVRPAGIDLTGDISDSTTISRWDVDPRIMPLRDEIPYVHARLAELRAAAGPSCRIRYICGNHDNRLALYIARQAGELTGMVRAGSSAEVMTLPYLLNLEALDIEWVGSQPGDLGSDYINAQAKVAEGLVSTHGYYSRKTSSSIMPLVESWDCSVIGGHDHRQGIVVVTKGGVATPVRRLYAISTGFMAVRNMGYLPAGTGNWQPGWATIEVYPDGTWSPDLAQVNPDTGVLTWRGQRWTVPVTSRQRLTAA